MMASGLNEKRIYTKAHKQEKIYPLNTNVPIKTIMMKVSTIHMNTLSDTPNSY